MSIVFLQTNIENGTQGNSSPFLDQKEVQHLWTSVRFLIIGAGCKVLRGRLETGSGLREADYELEATRAREMYFEQGKTGLKKRKSKFFRRSYQN